MKNQNASRLGFTLIELLVVVLIIDILASVALPQYNLAVEKSRAAEAWNMIRAINEAEKIKNLEEDTKGVVYPFEELGITLVDRDGANPTAFGFFTTNYEYFLDGEKVSLHSEEPVFAMRFYKDGNIMLSMENGRKYCATVRNTETQAAKLCKALVGSTQAGLSTDCVSGESCFTE